MFVCSVKSNTLKFALVIVLALAAVTTLVIVLPTGESVAAGSIFEGEETVSYDKVKTNKNRIAFLKSFGWESSETPKEEVEVRVPQEFDKVVGSYNEIQLAQGLDLSKYKGKTVTRYTYEIKNYPDYEGTVWANILIYKDRVIAGDICSSDVKGFIHGFEMPKKG